MRYVINFRLWVLYEAYVDSDISYMDYGKYNDKS
jgi:hypothetical protein